jgi:hypothetical protein
VTRQRSERYLQELGLAISEMESAMFLAFMGRLGENVSLLEYEWTQWCRFAEMVDSFFDSIESRSAIGRETERDCRERLCRKLLRRITAQSCKSGEALRLLAIARRIDPQGMRVTNLSRHAVRHLLKRIGVWREARSFEHNDAKNQTADEQQVIS